MNLADTATGFYMPKAIGAPAVVPTEEHLVLRISRRATVRIDFDGPVTQEAIERLIAHLELSKDTFPTEVELAEREAR